MPTISNPLILDPSEEEPKDHLFRRLVGNTDLEWYPCGNTTWGYDCAMLSVPLDYKKPNNGLKVTLPIVRAPAEKDVPYKGWVLTNFGGPGAAGTPAIVPSTVKRIRTNNVGPGWDILSFDPRGIGASLPSGDCEFSTDDIEPIENQADNYPSGDAQDDVSFGIIFPRGAPWKFEAERLTPESEAFAAACADKTGAYDQIGPHMNTVAVATDLLWIGKALAREKGEPEDEVLVNYLGFSYGTTIGQYFATLYPSNVGKFLLDGVTDPSMSTVSAWYNSTRTVNVDEGWSQFFPACHSAGPSKCAFYTEGSAEAIRDRFNNITSRLDRTRYQSSADIAAVDKVLKNMREILYDDLYRPREWWPAIAKYLASLEMVMAGGSPSAWDQRSVKAAEGQATKPGSKITRPFSIFQVACVDGRDIRGLDIDIEHQNERYSMSKLGELMEFESTFKCIKWKIRPSWEWYGPVGSRKTATPILFVGNAFDPATPGQHALKATKLFRGSRAIILDEIGHCSSSTNNTCGFNHIREYFGSDVLPDSKITRCKRETRLFA
ncbi:hypothetical protein H072_10142 [Dactylellina haptotyla CBS 200.50]|uniref:Peptidase S33 tripeptidyl aminopeptidase-like C-terminal domain-containing protein n=1 Tax=Dactylellina haptotyla (strain CBS 200.50) TaxID=1284197 RepID=S8A5J2_DACHA|nr:hypothetical protein H072_10142 [Dactylellina haptotyla CBS 200.50]